MQKYISVMKAKRIEKVNIDEILYLFYSRSKYRYEILQKKNKIT
jgi:DNA-binding LytR/AlgR family response regulator